MRAAFEASISYDEDDRSLSLSLSLSHTHSLSLSLARSLSLLSLYVGCFLFDTSTLPHRNLNYERFYFCFETTFVSVGSREAKGMPSMRSCLLNFQGESCQKQQSCHFLARGSRDAFEASISYDEDDRSSPDLLLPFAFSR